MSDKIAVIKTGGKQYKVKEGQVLRVEKLDIEEGGTVEFDTLLVAADDKVDLGKPLIGGKVAAKVTEQGRGKKISVIKYKNKTRYLRHKGHRQPYTKVEITGIPA